MRFLVDNYGPEAAGPCIADLSVEIVTPQMRKESVDSGYHSSGLGDVNKRLDIHLEHGRAEAQVAAEPSRFESLDSQEDIVSSSETVEKVGGEHRSVKEPKRMGMKLERMGMVGVSEVIVGGEISKSGKEKGNDQHEFLGVGKKWGR